MNTIPPRIYNNLYEVRENILTAFQPIIIKPPKCDRDNFSRNFSAVAAPKRNFLYKFANLHEHHSLLYNFFDLKILQNFSKDKLKSLFMLASLKDNTGMLRFSPSQLLQVGTMNRNTFDFIKPFARQKNSIGLFNFNFNELRALCEFSDVEKQKAMQLFEFKLHAKDLITLCKDKNANIKMLKQRLSVINQLYPQKINEISIKKYKNNYIIQILTEEEFKTYNYVFDNNFNLNPNYKSNIDFETGEFKKKGFFKHFKIFNNNQKHIYTPKDTNIPLTEHFETLDKIKEYADYLKLMQRKMYNHNCNTLLIGKGNLIKTNIKLPKNMLIDYWEKGLISNSDLKRICSDYAELIPDSDFKYFSLNKIELTPFDDEKILEIRRNNALSKPVEIGSEYYNKVLDEILKSESEKIKEIKNEKRMIIIDGLPGAGKSTIINKILKKDKTSFYTPDSDNIKTMFKEVYNNGENSNLVHKASGNILKNEIIPQVLSQGKNIIYQTTGDYISINKIINQATQNGYKIDFIQIPTSKNISLDRSIKRFNTNGRFLDPLTTISIFNTNNKEKLYSAKIFSHNPNIKNSYIYENGKLQLLKEGNYTGEYKTL